MSAWDTFQKKHTMAVCVDSDGCAMDTMNIKHERCFGPCMIREWGLEAWEKPIQERWEEINLYSGTRGINRFKGLAMALREVNDQYTPIEGIGRLEDWTEHAAELSNDAIGKMAGEDPVFQKALSWSVAVNEAIEQLPPEDVKPFPGVREALEEAHRSCDVVVVSSANPEAVRAEWKRFGLLDYVDLICTQEMGSKAYCISRLLDKGYIANHVLMCGDAPGDDKAAEQNGVFYYPILVRKEEKSWEEFRKEALGHLLNETYEGSYQNAVRDEFYRNLEI